MIASGEFRVYSDAGGLFLENVSLAIERDIQSETGKKSFGEYRQFDCDYENNQMYFLGRDGPLPATSHKIYQIDLTDNPYSASTVYTLPASTEDMVQMYYEQNSGKAYYRAAPVTDSGNYNIYVTTITVGTETTLINLASSIRDFFVDEVNDYLYVTEGNLTLARYDIDGTNRLVLRAINSSTEDWVFQPLPSSGDERAGIGAHMQDNKVFYFVHDDVSAANKKLQLRRIDNDGNNDTLLEEWNTGAATPFGYSIYYNRRDNFVYVMTQDGFDRVNATTGAKEVLFAGTSLPGGIILHIGHTNHDKWD